MSRGARPTGSRSARRAPPSCDRLRPEHLRPQRFDLHRLPRPGGVLQRHRAEGRVDAVDQTGPGDAVLAGRRAPEGLREDGVAALVAAGAGLDVLVLAGAPRAAGGVGEGQLDALRPQIALEQALGPEDPQPTGRTGLGHDRGERPERAGGELERGDLPVGQARRGVGECCTLSRSTSFAVASPKSISPVPAAGRKRGSCSCSGRGRKASAEAIECTRTRWESSTYPSTSRSWQHFSSIQPPERDTSCRQPWYWTMVSPVPRFSSAWTARISPRRPERTISRTRS